MVQERLTKLVAEIQKSDFLAGKGLSNEVNIRIFCYEPNEEMLIRHFIAELRTKKLKCRLKIYNLYEVFLAICEKNRIMDAIYKMEAKKGKDFLLRQLRRVTDNKAFVEEMAYAPHSVGDVILLTGVGEVFPFMRLHSLLEAMQVDFSDVPIVVFYPGKYDGRSLTLFNKLKPNAYYRAFNEL